MSRCDIEISESVQFVRASRATSSSWISRSGSSLGLDPVASHIWQSLAKHGDPAVAAEAQCRDYDAEMERALADIERWVGELEARGC